MKFITNTLLISLSLLFIACEDSTTTPIVSDVNSLTIDTPNLTIYSTDTPTPIMATVGYLDGTTADATTDIKWETDIDVLDYENGTIWGGVDNGGESSLTAVHNDFNDTTNVTVIKLTSFYIASNITTTGEHILSAKGNFENNATDRDIVKNIVWSADNSAFISISNDVVTIDINNGDTNVTATLFEDTNTSSPIAPQSIVFTIE